MIDRASIALAIATLVALPAAPALADGQTAVLGGLQTIGPRAPGGLAAPGSGPSKGEMGDCLDDADASGLGPKSALEACFQLVLTPDDGEGSFPADPDTSD